tara:strand:+ start:2448 stop:3170 length:723 start_codon:yes stop_codon:yes gene_type:complete
MKKVILCGYNLVGCEVLKILYEKDFELFVYTHESPHFIPDLISYCEKLSIPYSTDKISIKNLPFKPDIICSIYYRYIITAGIIDISKGKIFNIHPSLLPKFRGCSSITWALINNQKYTGFTYHYIDENIDTGNIIFQKEIKINNYDTGASLYMKVMLEAADHFEYVLKMVDKGHKGTPQIGDGKYYKRGAPYDGVISLKWSEEKIERFIRAMTNPPYPFATYKGIEIKSISEFKNIVNEE